MSNDDTSGQEGFGDALFGRKPTNTNGNTPGTTAPSNTQLAPGQIPTSTTGTTQGPNILGPQLGGAVSGLPIVGPMLGGLTSPAQVDLTPVHQAQDADFGTAEQLRQQRQAIGGDAPAYQTQVKIDQTNPNQIRDQQLQQLKALTSAANGTAPSAAEIQAKKQAGADVASQYALAATLKGHSAGGALAAANEGAATVNDANNANTAILRANEQAAARNALSSALTGTRTQDQSIATDQAQLQQQTNTNNLNSYNGLTHDELQAQLQAMGIGTQAATGGVQAAKDNAASQNATKSGVVNMVGGFLS